MATVAKKTNIANWFEVPVRDLGRATRFYEKEFDVKLTLEEMNGMKMAMFPSDQDAPGTTGALMQAETYEPSHAGTVVYFTVESIEETLRKINVRRTAERRSCRKQPSGSTGSSRSTRTLRGTGWRCILCPDQVKQIAYTLVSTDGEEKWDQ